MDKDITIKLKLAGAEYGMSCQRSDEPLYREAADLVRKEYQVLLAGLYFTADRAEAQET